MSIIRAVDLPELRDESLRWLKSDAGTRLWLDGGMRAGFLGGTIRGRDAVETIRQRELTRWRMAELFHVTADMTHLAVEAGKSLPSYELRRSDLPADFGFLYFDRPIDQTVLANGTQASVVACLWGIDNRIDISDRRGVWMSFYADRRFTLSRMAARGKISDSEVEAHASRGPRLAIEHEGVWWFDYAQLDDSAEWRASFGGNVESMMQTIRASWLLMAQQVASVHRPQPRHSQLRVLRRRGFDLNHVRIVSLRHRKSDLGDLPASERHFMHRWVVRGHWRNQWYPSQQRHIPLWINSHVKGPEDAPMLMGPVVNAWRR